MKFIILKSQVFVSKKYYSYYNSCFRIKLANINYNGTYSILDDNTLDYTLDIHYT